MCLQIEKRLWCLKTVLFLQLWPEHPGPTVQTSQLRMIPVVRPTNSVSTNPRDAERCRQQLCVTVNVSLPEESAKVRAQTTLLKAKHHAQLDMEVPGLSINED